MDFVLRQASLHSLPGPQEFFLLLGDSTGDLHPNADLLIPPAGPVQARNPAALHGQHLSGLNSGRDRERPEALEGGDLDLGPQRGLREVDGDVAAHVQITTGKDRVILDLDHDVEVSVFPPAPPLPLPLSP